MSHNEKLRRSDEHFIYLDLLFVLMKTLNRTKSLDDKSFILRLQNGYTLFVEYELEEDGKKYELHYTLWRNKDDDNYILIIESGDLVHVWEPADKRDERHVFKSPEEAIKFLEKKEDFKILDWGYHR